MVGEKREIEEAYITPADVEDGPGVHLLGFGNGLPVVLHLPAANLWGRDGRGSEGSRARRVNWELTRLALAAPLHLTLQTAKTFSPSAVSVWLFLSPPHL